jgi:formyltetrahydrofolate deformylase
MEIVIKIACKDEKGLVHKITGVLFEKLLNVTSTNEFVDELSNRFFMRISFTGHCEMEMLKSEIALLLPEFASVEVIPPFLKKKLLYW